ncbi:MAG: hypothetical protein MJZ04_10570 [Bacteroidales bacterium]|nr:hypothetical protein [Bacteroidales bacterium]
MKKILKAAAVMAAFLTVTAAAFAQNPQGKQENSWREKMMAEKIGFLTSAMELTSDEAQAFWPVYNRLEEQKEQQMRASRNAYKALSAALKEGKSDDEIAEILAQYTSAQLASADLEATCISEYGKVLPAQKIAKLIVGEEKFRRMQFQRFQGQGQGPGQMRGGERGPRPADRPQQK